MKSKLKIVLSVGLSLGLMANVSAKSPSGTMLQPEKTFTSTVQVHQPPSNIRDLPNGKVVCVVKKFTSIRLFGSTGVVDNNGEWYWTNHCGRMGVIHGSQFVAAG